VIGALRNRDEWQLFSALPRVHPGLAGAWWALVIARGLLPAVVTVGSALLVAAIRGDGPLTGPLTLVGTAFVVLQFLAPVHAQVGANLGDRLSDRLHDRLLAATTDPEGVAHLESRELTEKLAVARDFDLGMSGPPMALALDIISVGLVQAVAGLAQVAVLWTYHWWAALLVGGAWTATHWLLRESTVWDREAGDVRTAQRRAEYTYRLAVAPPAAKELRIFGLSDWAVRQFTACRRTLADLRWQAIRLRRRSLGRTVVLLFAANGIVFWSLARDAAGGSLSTAQALAYIQAAVGAAFLAFGGLNWAVPPTAESVASAVRLRDEMAAAGRLTSERTESAVAVPPALRFRRVLFHYPASDRPVLDGLDLTVPAGSSLGVVGLNGAGKTTLVKLLCRLHDPVSGAVEANGVDLRNLDPAAWRRHITVVFQDFIRYELPLRENVAPLGATDQVVEAALADAGAGGVGLDTVLAPGYDDGTDLSGGQWQRVALARMLCAVRQGADVVILDEPTAQLDVRGEAEIFERILDATRGRTTILISHRFSTVRRADRICVLEHGAVSEFGTHDELMAAGGRYRRMYDLQAAHFDHAEIRTQKGGVCDNAGLR
jgi:ABC-type multidrug transport system fused ATPase/permease subunit